MRITGMQNKEENKAQIYNIFKMPLPGRLFTIFFYKKEIFIIMPWQGRLITIHDFDDIPEDSYQEEKK